MREKGCEDGIIELVRINGKLGKKNSKIGCGDRKQQWVGNEGDLRGRDKCGFTKVWSESKRLKITQSEPE